MINEVILDLIKKGVYDQKHLIDLLKQRGFEVTQSSISRKLKNLNISKVAGKYVISHQSKNKELEIKFCSPNLVIIKTMPGNASMIAAKIDSTMVKTVPEIMGTIAGDDTIFVAIKLNNQNHSKIINQIINLLT